MKNVRDIKQVWLMGGFGNNLFQYLLFLRLKDKYDLTFLNPRLIQKNLFTKILGWKIHEPLILSITDQKVYSSNHPFIDLLDLLKLKIRNFKESIIHRDYISEELFSKENNFFGYYQSRRFIDESLNEIEELRKLVNSRLNITNKFELVVHFRWGDSIWAKQNTKYYEEIKNRINYNENILVVTDDQSAAENFFKNLNISITSSKNAMEDFKIMLSCKKLACAPSTFSWWASQLSNNCEEIILPEKIFERFGNPRNIKCDVI